MYGIERLSDRTDGIGLGARLNDYLPAAKQAVRLEAKYRRMEIPYHQIGSVKRINIGTEKQKAELPLLETDLTVRVFRTSARSSVTFILEKFRDGFRQTPVGRPLALGTYDQEQDTPTMRSDFGSRPSVYEAFDMLMMRADENDGSCSLIGKIWQEDELIVIATGEGDAVRQPQVDAFRFGNACMRAIATTSKLPVIYQYDQAQGA